MLEDVRGDEWRLTSVNISDTNIDVLKMELVEGGISEVNTIW